MDLSRRSAWVWYLVGALLTLVWKLVRYLRTEKRKGVHLWEATGTWFFEDSVENTISWVTTISLVWVGGAVLIDLRESEGIFSWVRVVPLHNAVAFALGGLMEVAAPEVTKNLVRWIISKMPGGA